MEVAAIPAEENLSQTFRTLTEALKEAVTKRKAIILGTKSEDELVLNNQEIMFALLKMKRIRRQLHQRISLKSERIANEKGKLESISNYYEGLLYQKNNIEREILNCKRNTQLPNLEKVEEVHEQIEFLGKRENVQEIDDLDKVSMTANKQEITESLTKELEKRKELMNELNGLSKEHEEKSTTLREMKQRLDEMPKHLKEIEATIKRGYSAFFNEPLEFSRRHKISIDGGPARLKVAVGRFADASDHHLCSAVVFELPETDENSLLFKIGIKVNISLKNLLAERISQLSAHFPMDSARQIPLELELEMVHINDAGILALRRKPLEPFMEILSTLFGNSPALPIYPAGLFSSNSSLQIQAPNSTALESARKRDLKLQTINDEYCYFRWFQMFGNPTGELTPEKFIHKLAENTIGSYGASNLSLTQSRRSNRVHQAEQEVVWIRSEDMHSHQGFSN